MPTNIMPLRVWLTTLMSTDEIHVHNRLSTSFELIIICESISFFLLFSRDVSTGKKH